MISSRELLDILSSDNCVSVPQPSQSATPSWMRRASLESIASHSGHRAWIFSNRFRATWFSTIWVFPARFFNLGMRRVPFSLAEQRPYSGAVFAAHRHNATVHDWLHGQVTSWAHRLRKCSRRNASPHPPSHDSEIVFVASAVPLESEGATSIVPSPTEDGHSARIGSRIRKFAGGFSNFSKLPASSFLNGSNGRQMLN